MTIDAIRADLKSASINLGVARASLDLWWFISHPERPANRREIENKLNRYFSYVREAQRRTMFVTLGALIDRHDDSISVPTLMKRLQASGFSCGRERKLFSAASPTIAKIRLIRNKVYAHRNSTKSDAEWFEDAEIKVWQIRRLTVVLQVILNSLRKKVEMPPYPFDPFAEHDISTLFKVLIRAYDRGAF